MIISSFQAGGRNAKPCLYCGEKQTRLLRHLQRKHPEKITHLSALTPTKRIAEVRKLRNMGVHEQNIKNVKSGKPIIRNRVSNTDKNKEVVICKSCFAVLGKNAFYHHDCTKSPSKGKPIALDKIILSNYGTDADFQEEIFGVLRNDEIGDICRKEKLIIMIGQKLFRSIGNAKPLQRRRRTTGVMRRIATLFKHFKNNFKNDPPTILDMFTRKYHDLLTQTIRRMHDDHKSSSMTVHYGSAMRIGIRSLISYFSAEEDEEQFEKLEQYQRHFTREWNVTFKEYEEDLKIKSQYKAKCPSNLPKQGNIQALLDKCYDNLETINVTDDYCRYRRSLYVILTVQNSRRGGEVSRLTISNANDGLNNVFSKGTQTNSEDKICYVPGKKAGTLVPITFENRLVPMIENLANPDVREKVGIRSSNPYLFASIKSSWYVSGNHEVKAMCEEIGMENFIKATDIRHFVASILPETYDMTARQKEVYLSHLGHSAEINRTHYQTALVEEEMSVGKMIRDVVAGKSQSNSCENPTKKRKRNVH